MHTLREQLRLAGLTAQPKHLQDTVVVDVRKTPTQQWREAIQGVTPLRKAQ